LHNIPEGIIVFISSYKNFKIGIKTVIAIMLHNIPEGLLISIPLYYSKKSRRNVIKKILIASISEPSGALLSYFVLGREVSDVILAIILLFVSGIMISLCFNEIQKELLKYNNKRYIIFGFELSVILVIILSLLN
jgi:ZIP family zinc transporter